MRFFASTSAVLAFAASVIAQTAGFNPIYTPGLNEEVPAGKNFQITWEATDPYKEANIKISLIGGATQGTLQPIADIATGVKNSVESYDWAVDASLGEDAIYGLVITLESDSGIFQYSTPFHITKAEEPVESTEETKPTVVKTTAQGVKTVSLSSYSTHESTAVPTPVNNTTTSVWVTSTVKCDDACEHTTSAPIVIPTSETYVPEPVPEPSYSAIVSEVPTPAPLPAGASAMVAGPLAIFGGLAVAMLAL